MALPAGVLPIVINEHFGVQSYIITGYSSAGRGVLAFFTSPALGAISDVVGRKYLFVLCVLGTSAPYALLGEPRTAQYILSSSTRDCRSGAYAQGWALLLRPLWSPLESRELLRPHSRCALHTSPTVYLPMEGLLPLVRRWASVWEAPT